MVGAAFFRLLLAPGQSGSSTGKVSNLKPSDLILDKGSSSRKRGGAKSGGGRSFGTNGLVGILGSTSSTHSLRVSGRGTLEVGVGLRGQMGDGRRAVRKIGGATVDEIVGGTKNG